MAIWPWKYYAVWRILCTTKCFFFGRKEPNQESNTFAATAETIISTVDTLDVETLSKGKELLQLQRDVENTRARRRLERWACKVIAVYLCVVFALLILNGLSMIWKPDIFEDHGFISDTVMYVILSTTTINIIGLGVIVLRGHFYNKDEHRADKDTITSPPVP